MNTDAFLAAAANGDLEKLRAEHAACDSRVALQCCDSSGNNALHLALLHGHWRAAVFLRSSVSCHKINGDKESVLHSYVRGVRAAGAPTPADFVDLREELEVLWEEENKFERERQEEVLTSAPKATPISKVPVAVYAECVFSRPELILPRYFIEGAHVYPYTQNSHGNSCRDLASSWGMEDLVEFFDAAFTPAAAKRRLMSSLSDDFLREVIEFL